MKKKSIFVYRTKRLPILNTWQRKEGPDSRLFGFNHIQKMDVDANFFDIGYSPLNVFHPALYPLEHTIISQIGMGFKLDQALALFPKFKNYDVIVATGDSAGLPILALKYFGLVKKPVIFMTAGLAGALKGKSKTWVFNFYKKILPMADVFTSYSQVEIDFFEKEMGIKKIKYIPLATDWQYFSQKSKTERKVICAIGTEQGRDYKTFFEAVRNLSIQAEVACHPDNIRGLKIPSNVKIHTNIPVAEVLKIYQRSLLSIVSCKERYRSSGQMVILESASAALPIVASKITGITSAFSFQDKKHLLFSKPEDPKDLRKKIQYLLNNKKEATILGQNASGKVKSQYTTKHLANFLAQNIKKL